ncbi:MAG: hypothetical protein MUF87_02555 [Anaerolineae bacterium]|jgi:hypothetical protein|nr:hypothetical protein [Anaerolineae bacterium]
MHILLIFLDGIGLGIDDPTINPFAAAHTPTLWRLANDHRWLSITGYQESDQALFIPTDAQLGLAGKPQSGTSQAAILTGRNIPQLIGRHYGPKPDAETRALLENDNFFKQVIQQGQQAALINAYPPTLLHNIARGKTLRSSIQHAVYAAGLPLFDHHALYREDAMSEDWTGQAWRDYLQYTDTPLYSPQAAGKQMIELSRRYDFAFFSHWMTDTVGHRGTVEEGVALIELFDQVMQGALETWHDSEGLIIITSDHGNLEAMDDRHHTENRVPTVVIGQKKALFSDLTDLIGLVPRMAQLLFKPHANAPL